MENFVKIGKKILVEGTKLVALAAGATVLGTFLREGTEGVRKLELDTLLGEKEEETHETTKNVEQDGKNA